MKFKSIILATLFLLTFGILCGCGGTQGNNTTSDNSSDTNAGSAENTTASESEDPNDTINNTSYNDLFGLTQKQADEKFGAILDGLFTGKTTEVKLDDRIGYDFAMHFPDMIYKDGTYYAYYISYATTSGKGGVGLATSTDGVNFTDCGVVIRPRDKYDCNGAYFAGVWLDDDGTFYLAYECKGSENTEYGIYENVAYATSTDGRNWEKKGVLLYKNTNSSWQTANIGTPDLYKKDGEWYVFFHGYNFDTCQIGVAHGTDLTNLTMEKKPVIHTKSGTAYSGTTGRRDIIHIGEWYYMVYEVSTAQTALNGFSDAYWTHMFARSKDLLTWETIEAPLLTQSKSGFGYDGPCWCIVGDHIYVYFRVGGSTERAELVLK